MHNYLFWLVLISWVIGSLGWSTTKNAAMDVLRNCMIGGGVMCLQPLAGFAEIYPCPQSITTQSLLGIQNVAPPKQVPPTPSIPPTPAPLSGFCSETMGYSSLLDYSIQGVIYLPSSATKGQQLPADGILVITISSIDKPFTALAGAQIPMVQIHSFPISFSLSKANLLSLLPAAADKELEVEWDNKVLYAPYDLIVTAKILDGESNLVFQGQGYSKMLNLPSGDDDFRVVRAASSVRLAQIFVT